MKFYTLKHRLTTLFATTVIIAIFALAGYFIGKKVGNVNLFIMLGVLISYPFSLFGLTKVLKGYVKQEEKEEDLIEKQVK
ncbi:hypothetical protein COY25_04330 [Candidatus Uhrbacteria bacterium CG_4_10_14_0_2_um_filter_41_7]|uniref:Uncharacterized protein n=1 Tax=Candidatus Uhrbacteria bacterium CG_4_9_14_3_um_filter_41_35 TaxID=1975034 RepID=A0A2M7XFA4_9BACT|nr:MAG: hypothetical protein COY25_04330 [Candidatus Uhrbacteria bacterium CG_4_10_14_0_2_um_filter_41_7]PJA46532.1 MAG: hypothetical protein CO173_02080 [Candidatus Uhrbacteria bacterium CG_4_9_14_3_um_filter_41_35]